MTENAINGEGGDGKGKTIAFCSHNFYYSYTQPS